MAWLYVPGPEDSNSPCDSPSPDTAVWLTLSGTPTRRPRSWRGWKTRAWIALLCGTTSPPSTLTRGVDSWISSLRGSRASRGVQQVKAPASMTSGGSGRSSLNPFADWNPASRSWRTCRLSLLEVDSDSSSVTWPKSGSMRSGWCSERPTLVGRTSAPGCSSWPTATATDCKASGGNPNTTGTHETTLTDRAVRLWPTPVARDDQKSPEAHLAMKARMPGGPRQQVTSLTVLTKMWQTPSAADAIGGHLSRSGSRSTELLLKGQAKFWPTPAAHDSKGSGPSQYERNSLMLPEASLSFHLDPTTSTSGGPSSPNDRSLNPHFTEWLMGWPIGWTDTTRSATESYRSWLQRHSLALRAALGSLEVAA